MEYENIKLFDINGIINIQGTWTQIKKDNCSYKGNVFYSEPLYNISFIEYFGSKLEWEKSCKQFASSPRFHINMYHHMDFVNKNGLPKIFNGEMEIGKIFLLTEYDNIKKYEIYITKNVIKMGRNGIWKIKDNYINELNEMIINKIQYGRSGIIYF